MILTTVLNKDDKLDIYYVELASNGIILMTKISLEILNPGKINCELKLIVYQSQFTKWCSISIVSQLVIMFYNITVVH